MPVKLGSKLPENSHEARIEIIPLIDIMFFLLAAFMLVSLSMVSLRVMKVNLPAASTSAPDTSHKDVLSVSIDATGAAFLDRQPMAENELVQTLATAHQQNPNLNVVISGDAEAKHGSMIHVLDMIRAAGIDRVAFETRAAAIPQGVNRP